MIYGAIVAGGTGSRMGADIPKQFLPLCGKPVLIRTIERFLSCGSIDIVYVGVHSDWTERLAEMCRENALDVSRIRIIRGGSDRNGTIFRIVDEIGRENGISDEDIIVTHDGVRPFVTPQEIEDSISAMRDFGGVTVCAPVKDTILMSESGRQTDSVPPREKLFRTLTPQTFRLKLLNDTRNELSEERISALTDTAGVLGAAGIAVGLVMGSEYNIKLTTPIDMKLGELILEESEKT